ncbi:hypothetical protein KPE71_13955 [Acinetobacter soli]|uniref:hypothetical protein n=1 Tax=Acinetobacter soli TaxID=487316 RepID=UPI001C0DD1AA|nr:hypothetical protein [Acinetobacter soli]MBU3121358.1 hypothetical protein [Acinetobacter soli]
MTSPDKLDIEYKHLDSNAILTPELNTNVLKIHSSRCTYRLKSKIRNAHSLSERKKIIIREWCKRQLLNLEDNPSNAVLVVEGAY